MLLFLFSDPILYDTDFVRTVHFVGKCLKKLSQARASISLKGLKGKRYKNIL